MKWYVEEKAEALANLFLLDLKPEILGKPTVQQAPYDYLATFVREGAPIMVAVEVKATEDELRDNWSLRFSRRQSQAMRTSNIPFLILVIDVKRNDLRFNWSTELSNGIPRHDRGPVTHRLPLRKNTQHERAALRREIHAFARTPLAVESNR